MDIDLIFKALSNPLRRQILQWLSVLQQAGLVLVQKHGQWCYFSRNEAVIQSYIQHLQQAL